MENAQNTPVTRSMFLFEDTGCAEHRAMLPAGASENRILFIFYDCKTQ